MTTQAKNVWTYFFIGFFLIGVLRLLQGCTRYVEVKPEVVVEMEPWGSCANGQMCLIGQVVCSNKNQPVIVLRKGISESELPFTLKHERVHQVQMQADCFATRDKYRSDENVRWNMELEAYCAEAEARIKAGMPIQGVVGGLTAILRALYNATDEDISCNWMRR